MSVQAAPYVVRLEHEKIGDDGRLPVADSLRVPFRWICALDVCFAGDRRRHRGSGVLIGPRQVLTAAHVLYRTTDGAGPSSVDVAPARSGRTDPVGRIKAVAYSVPGKFFSPPPRVSARSKVWAGSRFDLALVTLGSDAATLVPAGSTDRQVLSHWGHQTGGAGTVFRGLERTLVGGKRVTTSGYPTDRCGAAKKEPAKLCPDRRDWSTVQFWHPGTVLDTTTLPGLLLHDADTFEGQSGSPVWMTLRDGRRLMVGIHLGARILKNKTTGARLPVRANKAVHLSPEVVTWVRSLMPGQP
jgi:V8-like Glu-specific endopeptidase